MKIDLELQIKLLRELVFSILKNLLGSLSEESGEASLSDIAIHRSY